MSIIDHSVSTNISLFFRKIEVNTKRKSQKTLKQLSLMSEAVIGYGCNKRLLYFITILWFLTMCMDSLENENKITQANINGVLTRSWEPSWRHCHHACTLLTRSFTFHYVVLSSVFSKSLAPKSSFIGQYVNKYFMT